MSDLSNKILKVLSEQGISDIDISTELFKVREEIEILLWEKITISPLICYMLKDTIFFNFEHLEYSNDITGRTDLRNYGQQYPVLMFGFNGDSYIEKEFISQLFDEIGKIKSKWNSNIYVANLSSTRDFDWNVGEKDPSTLIVYDKDTESPKKYGAYSNSGNYSNIYGTDGNPMKRNDETVLCAIRKIDMYREYNLLTETLNNLYNTIRNAIENQKGIHINFNGYDYEQ